MTSKFSVCFLRLYFGFTLFFYISQSRAQTNECWSHVKEIVEQKDKDRDALYRQITNGATGINDRQGSIFLEGGSDSRALVLLHGYPSFPRHFSGFAKLLNEKYGYTIYAPLLSGLGSAAIVGNRVTVEDWRNDTDQALALVSQCTNKVSLIGHSMGGGLAIDTQFNPISTAISSLVLICPMVKTKTNLGRILASIARTIGIKTFGPISTRLVKQVFRVVDNIQNYWDSSVDNKVPTFLSVSYDDKTISSEAAKEFAFEKMNVVDGMIFQENSNVGHNEIITPRNPYLEELVRRVDIFLREN